MVIENPIAAVNAAGGANGNNNAAHPSGIPQDKIDNIMSGIANTGDVKMNNHRKKLRQRFDIIKKLGQGTYGKVQLGINKETGQEVAIKTIKKCKIEAEADLVRIRREVQIMSSVQHPNIIHIYEVFENREKMVLVMEFAAGGELYDYLSERKVLSEEEARRIFRQVATAVYYCHKHKICHRDLKLENILLDEHGNAKIADFGLSNVFDDQHLLGTFCGSPLYASPEIVEGTPYWGPEVDCWSLGVLLYTLVYGSMPFDGSNFKRLVKQISQGDYYEPKKPSRASSLIREMLTVCPQKRASIEQICAHWWVNENDNVSCLELAENLANQTPVRLDVLLSLTPAAVVAEQLVVPSADGCGVVGVGVGGGGAVVGGKGGNTVMPRSHSVGSIRDMSAANPTTEAEQRILDMVAAGGEAALMPSPTRTITPAQSPVQTKRKLETTVSMENAAAALKKKEKAGSSSLVIDESTMPLTEENIPMETEDGIVEEPGTPAVQHNASVNFSQKDMELIDDMCAQLMQQDKEDKTKTASPPIITTTEDVTNDIAPPATVANTSSARQKTMGKLDAVQETPEEKEAAKVINKFVNKHKTADLVNAIGQVATTPTPSEKSNDAAKRATTTNTTNTTPTKQAIANLLVAVPPPIPFVRKCSLQDESALSKFNGERRKSRILETAEKFQQMNANGTSPATTNVTTATKTSNDKPKKIVIPGVSVGSYKKEYERRASNASNAQQKGPTPGERRAKEEVAAAAAAEAEAEASLPPPQSPKIAAASSTADIESSDSKNSVHSLSLDEARRSMENSIALLRQAQNETTTQDVDQLCAKTESIGVSEHPKINIAAAERERKLQNARAIIGNAIQPVIRRPQAQPQLQQPSQPQSQLQPTPPTPISTPPSFLSSATFYGAGGEGGRSFGGYIQMRDNIFNPNNQIGMGPGNGSGNGNGSGGGGSGSLYAVDNIKNINKNGNSESSGNETPIGIPSKMAAANNISKLNLKFIEKNSHSSAAALAKARQNIMRHFATGGTGWNFLSSLATPATQQQKQFQQPPLINARQPQGANVSLKAKIFDQQEQQKRQKITKRLSASHSNVAAPFYAANIKTATSTANTNNNSLANNVVNMNSIPKPFYNARTATPTSSSWLLKSSPSNNVDPNNGTVKTSTASITLKSATLPRRKTAKTEIQLDIKPRIVEQEPAMRFSTEMQHPIADMRSAPVREGPSPYSPVKTMLNSRATSLEPKEHIIHIQRPPQMAYTRTTSNSTNKSGSLSRQSTNDSESDTTTNLSQSTMAASSQPIKKSPREFIIPIAVEGGGFITPREGSIEPSESSHTTSSRSTFNRFNQRPTRRIGSLLSETGVDESGGIQFPKMRTSSSSRDGDEDTRFTLHRLRSSRPVKKISQDNDSNSSGEEDDDDDGFEILTAENLFSTLLQRVRALTNRLNVNNDLTTGFPNSCRLLTSMRHDRGPFWNQEPFTRSQMSYTYSETVEKKHVRLKNTSSNNSNNSGATGIGAGAPWRHSMSRDLGSDMDSMFSRTGATLPRGSTNKAAKKSNQLKPTLDKQDPQAATSTQDNTDSAGGTKEVTSEEPLDLADLDLSRLRLSKKELETLSSIAPGLPKCFQEQLLAKLPPTQARKLSRTLSMQNEPNASKVKVSKRSQSGGRSTLDEVTTTLLPTERCAALPEESESSPAKVTNNKIPEASSIKRRTLSRSIPIPHTLDSSARKSRSNSVCRDDYSKSLCSSYTSDISDKYKYYSPYLSKSARDTATATTTTTSMSAESGGSVSPYKRYSSVSPRESTIGAVVGRPPSGCLSPPPEADNSNNNSLRRRTTQRRISRFLRPDFYEDQSTAETPYQREKKKREREAQSVLREIREKSSREPSRERGKELNDENAAHLTRKHSVAGTEAELFETRSNNRHMRNKSMELYNELDRPKNDSPTKSHRRSLSRTRNSNETLDTHALADKILQELQLLSAMRSEQEKQKQIPVPVAREVSVERTTETNTVGLTDKDETVSEQKTVTVKKVKKIKPKDKCSNNEGGDTTTTTVVKKVKKIVKKADGIKTPGADMPESLSVEQSTPKESKLKRPKSYPTKEPEVSTKLLTQTTPVIPEVHCEAVNCSQQCDTMTRESRLIRPKSYPASKLTQPKDLKKVVAVIPPINESKNTLISEVPSTNASSISRQSTSEEKSLSAAPTEKSSVDTSSSSESRPTIKKIIKVSKKSKLIQPTPLTPTTPTATSVAGPLSENTKEWKEKSPDKKPSKGLLYAIGQKFEKFRDSAMNKEKKALLTNSASSSSAAVNSAGNPSEKIEKKTSLLKKKKSLDGAASTPTTTTTKTEKTANKSNLSDEKKTKKLQEECALMTKPPAQASKIEKRSRLDAMIRSIRERSVPRGGSGAQQQVSASQIKRALSVEDINDARLNKNAVNRVLGLFKRSDKEGSNERVRVRSTRSTSNLERQLCDSTTTSPIYQNSKEAREAAVKETLCHGVCDCENIPQEELLTCPDCVAQNQAALIKHRREARREDVSKKSNEEITTKFVTNNSTDLNQQGNKDKRKGLMLDLVKLENVAPYASAATTASTSVSTTNTSTATRNSKAAYINGNIGGIGSTISNGLYSNLPPYPYSSTMPNSSSNHSSSQHSMENTTTNTNNNSSITNNNNNNNNYSSMQTSQTSGYRTSSTTHEINRNNILTPSNENIANYSSDCSRSFQDDCASTSTFLSPTDEPELYFDNWSICSEDNYILHATPSPTVSRLSRASQLSSPTSRGGTANGGDSSDPNESVIDRIKRRSFYSRFNEKKPKRQSTIVGPSAVRDYYREQKAAMKATRSTNKPESNNIERNKSPDITQEFLRPLKLSPVGTELKPPVYKSPYSDYTHHSSSATSSSTMLKPRKSLNDIRSPSYMASKHRYGMTSNEHSNHDYPHHLTVPSSTSATSRYKSSSSTSPYDGSSNASAIPTGIGSAYYSTYNPKRRSSYTLNGILPSGNSSGGGTSNIDSYATLGRRSIRPYDQRTISLLDTPNGSSYRRDTRTPLRDYATPSISRSDSRYRATSATRSPTNI